MFSGDSRWQAIKAPKGDTFKWDNESTYIRQAPYFDGMGKAPPGFFDIKGARVLALLGDSITTDHISPAGNIKAATPAGKYLLDHGVAKEDFNQYGARRGNHEVMVRGTFANIRLRNKLVPEVEGGYTRHLPDGKEVIAISDAGEIYQREGVPTVILAGKEYGSGSSRDWAAKGPMLQGVKAVIAQSFERIHRSNLVGMGVVPFTFVEGTSWASLDLKGDEMVTIHGLADVKPRQMMEAEITYADGSVKKVPILCRIDTLDEIDYFKNAGILHYVLRGLAAYGLPTRRRHGRACPDHPRLRWSSSVFKAWMLATRASMTARARSTSRVVLSAPEV